MSSPSAGPVSVVATVLNETTTIDALLEGLAAQSSPAGEVVIVDGGSSDGTREKLAAWAASRRLPLMVIDGRGLNIAAGRNRGIKAAAGPVIAVTDAGVTLPADWLIALTAPLGAATRWTAGFFRASPRSAFEYALGATTLPHLSDVNPERFLPSSRSVAFLKADWERVGGYPEWLDYGEDLVFDMALIAAAGRPAFAPAASVGFRPRSSLSAFARQYYLYARGDGKANLWPARHAIRYGVYLLAGPGLVMLGLAGRGGAFATLAVGIALLLRRPWQRLVADWHPLAPRERLEAATWVPVIQVVGDLAKMAGYLPGVRWRRRHNPPHWRPQAGLAWL